MKWTYRTMLAAWKTPLMRRGKRTFLRKRRKNVVLSDDAMQVVMDLAKRTGSSPSDVLKNSVTLYKLALDSRRDKSQPTSMTSS